jgi:hypothetical protein
LGVLDERGDLIARFDLPVIGEGKRRRIDADSIADFILQHAPYAFAIVEQASSRPEKFYVTSWNPSFCDRKTPESGLAGLRTKLHGPVMRLE